MPTTVAENAARVTDPRTNSSSQAVSAESRIEQQGVLFGPLAERLAPTIVGPCRTIISISDLSKTYASGFQALKSVDLDIRRGEIFALLGPNGAGKTTLISIVCGIVNPSAGSVTVDGHDIVTRLPRRPLADRPGAAGADHRRLRDGVGHRQLQPRPVRQAAQSRPHRQGAEGSVAVGQERQQDHDALRRHEAARDDRQGAVARAADPVPRRAHRRRRRRAAQGHVGDGARAARRPASPSS